MSMQQPSFRPRPGGGFNQGLGQFGEHLDEEAMQQAVQQKAMSQQASSQTAVPTPPPGTPLTPNAAQPPEGGPDLFTTVVSQPIEAVSKTLLSISGLDTLLGISLDAPVTPEEKAQKQAMLRRYNQLTDAEQAAAKEVFQRRLHEEQLAEQEAEQKRQQEAAKADAQPVMAQGKQSGAQEPGHASKKQQQLTNMYHERKTLTGPQSAG